MTEHGAAGVVSVRGNDCDDRPATGVSGPTKIRCNNASLNSDKVKDTSPKRQKCVVCHNWFDADAYEVKRGRGKCCSRTCAGRATHMRRFSVEPTVQIGTLAPGTKFRIETTDGEVVAQHPVCRETAVRFHPYGAEKVYRSVWCSTVNVRVVA